MRSDEKLCISEVSTNVIVAEPHQMRVVFKAARSTIIGFHLDTILLVMSIESQSTIRCGILTS